MDILTAVLWVAGILAGLMLLLVGAGVVILVGFLIVKAFTRKAAAAGIDLSDGIDAKEMEIILGMISKQRATAAEQAVAVQMVTAAQAALQQSGSTKPPAS